MTSFRKKSEVLIAKSGQKMKAGKNKAIYMWKVVAQGETTYWKDLSKFPAYMRSYFKMPECVSGNMKKMNETIHATEEKMRKWDFSKNGKFDFLGVEIQKENEPIRF